MSDTTVQPREIDAGALADARAAHETLLVQFQTNGCSICSSMEPVVGNVAREVGVPAVFVNPRDPPGLVEEYQITSVPTLVVFRDGEPVARLADGFVPGERLTAFLENHI